MTVLEQIYFFITITIIHTLLVYHHSYPSGISDCHMLMLFAAFDNLELAVQSFRHFMQVAHQVLIKLYTCNVL